MQQDKVDIPESFARARLSDPFDPGMSPRPGRSVRTFSPLSPELLIFDRACGSAGRDPFDQSVFFDSHLTAQTHNRQKPLTAQFIGPLERHAETLGYFIHVQQADLCAYSGEVGHRFRWMWAGVRRASRWGKVMMPEVAHMGQEKSGITSSSRLHHFVSVIALD